MPYSVEFDPIASKELNSLDKQVAILILKHAKKLENYVSKKHLQYGIPHFVEKVTKQARIVFDLNQNIITIIHCFGTHKEYERWYKSYK